MYVVYNNLFKTFESAGSRVRVLPWVNDFSDPGLNAGSSHQFEFYIKSLDQSQSMEILKIYIKYIY